MKRTKIILLGGVVSLIIVFVFLLIKKDKNDNIIRYIKINGTNETEIKLIPKEARILELKKFFTGIKVPFGETVSKEPINNLMREYHKLKKLKNASETVEWITRGPSNVGGRSRGLIIDPDDPEYNTWYVGSATGGVWKTTDRGKTWVCLTNELPYQATTTLAMAMSNTNIIYMGTGESFPGSMQTTGGGIFKSTDKGNTWNQLEATSSSEDFRYINRIIVDPDDEDIVLAITQTGIFKTTDGGTSWEQKYESTNAVEHIIADASDFDIQFAAENGKGVLRSLDAGDTWENKSKGISPHARIELALCATNSQKVYASFEKLNDLSELYCSWDQGENWQLVVNEEDEIDYLGGQGYYDNTIAVHPYDENTVFIGGVSIWKSTMTLTVQEGEPRVLGFEKENTDSFLDFILFTGNLLPGFSTGDMEDAYALHDTDFVSIEIRFGPGLSQKAHRFFVPEEATSGVSYDQYTYQDYIDVPFQVWDVSSNPERQLMCSFRDQERDGAFNLYERTGEDYGELGREYLFINSVEYDPNIPSPDIAQTGGRSYKLIYFFWPTLAEGGTWDPENLPESKISIEWGSQQERIATTEIVGDVYGRFGGLNEYIEDNGGTTVTGLHPDQHNLFMVPINEASEDFWIVVSNDGGLALSTDNGVNFTQLNRNFITTQFYGVAKKPIYNEYIGGTQDNGTWQSPIDINASLDTAFHFRVGGDGFEIIWNQQDPVRIMASIYYNNIRASYNGGLTWQLVTDGIVSGDGPFITRLSAVPSNNNIVFAVGSDGIYKTISFAYTGWETIEIGEGWSDPLYGIYWNQVEVSPANEQIVWAGAGNDPDNHVNMFVSTNQGESFSAVEAPDEPVPSMISGLAVHPTDENTAYMLYGTYGYPKILRTTDLGDTWEDISQFEGGESQNGFPDVVCWSLFVFPDNTDRIWAGTDIGIVESTDNGESWHYLNSNMPAVPVWQIFIQDNQIVAATFGRGIMTYQYGDPLWPSAVDETSDDNVEFSVYPNPSRGIVTVDLPEGLQADDLKIEIYSLNGRLVYTHTEQAIGTTDFSLDLTSLDSGIYLITIRSGNALFTQRIILK